MQLYYPQVFATFRCVLQLEIFSGNLITEQLIRNVWLRVFSEWWKSSDLWSTWTQASASCRQIFIHLHKNKEAYRVVIDVYVFCVFGLRFCFLLTFDYSTLSIVFNIILLKRS